MRNLLFIIFIKSNIKKILFNIILNILFLIPAYGFSTKAVAAQRSVALRRQGWKDHRYQVKSQVYSIFIVIKKRM